MAFGRSPPRIAAIGSVTWDVLIAVDRYPVPAGGSDFIHHWVTAPGGTTANTAVALARLGASVALAALVGDDPIGDGLVAALRTEGVDTTWIATHPTDPTDACLIVVSKDPPTRTIYWQRGARLGREHRLDVPAVVAHDVLYLDVDDRALHASLTADLASHPDYPVRVLASLQYPAGTASTAPWPDAFSLILRHDVATGDEGEWLRITGTTTHAALVERLQEGMRDHRLCAGFITRGSSGCSVCTPDDDIVVAAFPVNTVDTTGAGDAFAGGVAYGLTQGWEWRRIAHFANAVGALATRALGAQSALPTLVEVLALTEQRPADAS
jgi:sugar/nucleoside kinase (ribokinase family)